jgi:hypothetical protein
MHEEAEYLPYFPGHKTRFSPGKYCIKFLCSYGPESYGM